MHTFFYYYKMGTTNLADNIVIIHKDDIVREYLPNEKILRIPEGKKYRESHLSLEKLYSLAKCLFPKKEDFEKFRELVSTNETKTIIFGDAYVKNPKGDEYVISSNVPSPFE